MSSWLASEIAGTARRLVHVQSPIGHRHDDVGARPLCGHGGTTASVYSYRYLFSLINRQCFDAGESGLKASTGLETGAIETVDGQPYCLTGENLLQMDLDLERTGIRCHVGVSTGQEDG